MSIGIDIKEVLEEVSNAITIKRDSGDITGEYTRYLPNSQVTKPFIREFFLEGILAYDTDAVVGDLVEFNVTGETYFLMNKTPAVLENLVYKYDSIFYKTNEVVDILRPSAGSRPSQSYHQSLSWSYVKRSASVLITTPLYGHELDEDEAPGSVTLEVHEMYVPTSWGVRVLDRVRLSSQVYYQVNSIKPRRCRRFKSIC